MDATEIAVQRLYEQGYSPNMIARRIGISVQKTTKILINIGAIVTDECRLQKDGLTISEIAERLGKSEKAVLARLPYSKGLYNAEYPTTNALRIRRCRNKRNQNESGGER